jgi:predicted AlkP superfamily phosphohydrolase/phosphomutase
MTYPPRPIEGLMVSGLMTPLGSRDSTQPPGFLERLEKMEPGYRILPTRTYTAGRPEGFLDDLEGVFASKLRVMMRLLKEEDWSFAMQVFNETDFLQHAMWHVLDPGHPRHGSGEAAYAGRVRAFYEKVDGALGKVLDLTGEETSVIVVSDHGHGPLHRFIHANNALLEGGLMKVRRGFLSGVKRFFFNLGLTPLNAYRAGNALGLGRLRIGLRWTTKGHDMLRSLFFSFSDIDWSRTVAYAISGGVYGFVYINGVGREPRGAVPPERYEEVRSRVAELLGELRDQGSSIVVVHHDLATVRSTFDWALVMNVRTVACGPVAEAVTPEHLRRAYGSDAVVAEQQELQPWG